MIHKQIYQWVQCSAKNPCPECGGQHHCTLSTNGIMSKCMKSPGGKEVKQSDGQVGYLRRVSECRNGAGGGKTHKPKAETPKLTARELEIQVKACRTALSARRLDQAIRELGVTDRALKLMDVGWHHDMSAVSFPMRDGMGNLCGIRLRYPDGKKLSVPGSRTGLFIPTNYEVTDCPLTDATTVLLMPEGPTDVAAALDLGFMAVGRPNNSGGAGQVAGLLSMAKQPVDLVLFADNDGAKWLEDGTPYSPGWEGALHVAYELMSHRNLARLRVVMPPKGTKDLRAWLKSGIGFADVFAHVESQPTATPLWIGHKLNALRAIKRETKRIIDAKKAPDRDTALRMAKEVVFRAPAMA